MKKVYLFLEPQSGPINEFEVLYLKTTFVRFLDDIGILNLEDFVADRFRERTRLVFDSSSDLAHMPGPKFVFIHILATHPPFVFNELGNSVSPYEIDERDGYIKQAKYINNKIIESAKIIISQSETPPIIIIQADHGLFSSNPDWRFGILNAYFLPGKNDLLYPTITPVNTFRLVFNNYFRTDYQLLPDISYYSDVPYLYDFSTVENEC